MQGCIEDIIEGAEEKLSRNFGKRATVGPETGASGSTLIVPTLANDRLTGVR